MYPKWGTERRNKMNKAVYLKQIKEAMTKNPNMTKLEIISIINSKDADGVGAMFDELQRLQVKKTGAGLVTISSIKTGDRLRGLKQDEVARLAASIKEVGLLSPILIDTEMNLIAGHHRLEACKSLGHEKIQAIIVSMTELERDLAEIDENLIRNELSAFERSEHLAKRKEIYEQMHPPHNLPHKHIKHVPLKKKIEMN